MKTLLQNHGGKIILIIAVLATLLIGYFGGDLS